MGRIECEERQADEGRLIKGATLSKKPDWTVYIDESGDEGTRFGAGSSDWFVLGAALFDAASEPQSVDVIRQVRAGINQVQAASGRMIPEKKALHFRDLKHEQKKYYCATIARSKADLLAVAVHKPSLSEMTSLTGRSQLFFWTAWRLLSLAGRRISAHQTGSPQVEFCFSNRSGMSKAEIGEWLQSAVRETNTQSELWEAAEVSLIAHSKRAGLQIADAVASSYFACLQPNGFGQTEDGYIRILSDRVTRLHLDRDDDDWHVLASETRSLNER